jgi:hypothetical protein
MTSTNYTGRRVDLFVFQGARFDGQKSQITPGFGDRGRVVAGVQRAVQQWAILLLTRRGTLPGSPELGTEFLDQADRGELRDTMAVTAAFNSAVMDVQQQLAVGYRGDEYQDEIISQAELKEVNITAGGMDLTVELQTAAGRQLSVILPVAVAIS